MPCRLQSLSLSLPLILSHAQSLSRVLSLPLPPPLPQPLPLNLCLTQLPVSSSAPVSFPVPVSSSPCLMFSLRLCLKHFDAFYPPVAFSCGAGFCAFAQGMHPSMHVGHSHARK